MASKGNIRQEYADVDRKLEEDLFGNEDKPARPPSNTDFIAKFLRPATSPRRQKITKAGDGIDFDGRLKWPNLSATRPS